MNCCCSRLLPGLPRGRRSRSRDPPCSVRGHGLLPLVAGLPGAFTGACGSRGLCWDGSLSRLMRLPSHRQAFGRVAECSHLKEVVGYPSANVKEESAASGLGAGKGKASQAAGLVSVQTTEPISSVGDAALRVLPGAIVAVTGVTRARVATEERRG